MDHQYFPFQEEGHEHLLPNVLHSLANYSNTIPSASVNEDTGGEAGDAAPPAAKSANLGTLMGVYLPCIQNIFGVILFIRLTWVVGTSGIICGFLVSTWFITLFS